MTTTNTKNLLEMPLYADRPQRRIPGTKAVAVTMRQSADRSVAEYAIFTEDGLGHLGTAYFQPARLARPRCYAMVSCPSFRDETFKNLAEFAREMARRNGLAV
jgi:hypothetical protein